MALARALTFVALATVANSARAADVRFDLGKAGTTSEWTAQHDVASIRSVQGGMAIAISGSDPYIFGPARDYPARTPLWLSIRLKSPSAGMAQVFWFTAAKGANEEDSVRFPVAAGPWNAIRVPIPPLGPGARLRLDPPGDHGTVTVSSIVLSPRASWREPAWPKPPVGLAKRLYAVTSGSMEVIQSTGGFGAFSVRVGGKPMAEGNARPLIAYVFNGRTRWLDVNRMGWTGNGTCSGIGVAGEFVHDPDGGVWTVAQTMYPGRRNSVRVVTTVSCSRDRDILYMPMLTLLPGAGSFGVHKNQALFAGLEYLDGDEPSSSEKDIVGPGANRRVPDTAKITQPLMVVQSGGRYVGLTWKPSPQFCAVFDSPDRTFNSGGHLVGVLFPGSDGSNREEGSLLPYDPVHVKANTKITLIATIIGGIGDSVVPALRQNVALNPPPKPVSPMIMLNGFAPGWLDSGIHQDGLYRHAYPGSFEPQPAADAAMWLDWLASLSSGTKEAQRWHAAAVEALAQVPVDQLNTAGVGHVRYPAPALAYNHAMESVRAALREGRDLLGRFEPDGSVIYRPKPGGTDLGRTHFAKDANGLTAELVARVLGCAEYTGDPELRRAGLRLLDALGKFANTAPRGAQTWEVPLHTPDILASANLVRAYVLGYELTGKRQYLDSARYWAWTGVPFVYLVPPAPKPIGLYGTIAVYGATRWVAPNWMGLPVQWCGLVYAASLVDLMKYDASGPWASLIRGIAASGAQQTHVVGPENWPGLDRKSTRPFPYDPKRQGLLPDSFNLHGQIRNDVAINPGTLMSVVPWVDGLMPVYSHNDFENGMIVHAAGVITSVNEAGTSCSFKVRSWAPGPCQVLVVGVHSRPKTSVNGKGVEAEFDPTLGALVIPVPRDATIDLKAG